MPLLRFPVADHVSGGDVRYRLDKEVIYSPDPEQRFLDGKPGLRSPGWAADELRLEEEDCLAFVSALP